MKEHEKEFLEFPDGWDYSLYHLMQKGLVPETMVRPIISRVRNIGEWEWESGGGGSPCRLARG